MQNERLQERLHKVVHLSSFFLFSSESVSISHGEISTHSRQLAIGFVSIMGALKLRAGLEEKDAGERLKRDGLNELLKPKPPSLAILFLMQLVNVSIEDGTNTIFTTQNDELADLAAKFSVQHFGQISSSLQRYANSSRSSNKISNSL